MVPPPPQADEPPDEFTITLKGHSRQVTSVAFSPSEHLLASGSQDTTIKLWNLELGTPIAILRGHENLVTCVRFSPDGTTLASGSWDKTINLWNVHSGALIAPLKGHLGFVYSVAFSPDGKYLASGSNDKTARIWDVESKLSFSIFDGHSDGVTSVVFSPSGDTLASGSYDCTVRLWSPTSRTCLAILTGHSASVFSVAFSPRGEYLASGSFDNTIQVWDVPTGASLTVLKGHPRAVRSVGFSPSGEQLASGSNDGTIWIWDVASRTHSFTLKGPEHPVWSLSFSPNGRFLASGSSDETVRLWNLAKMRTKDANAVVYSSQLAAGVRTEESLATTPGTVPLSNDITGAVSLAHPDRIALGGFADLFLGLHQNRGRVALKRPHRLFDEASIRRFLREVDLWCSVSCKYVLPCLGMCKIGPEVYVVSPFIENGDLVACISRGMALNLGKLLYEIGQALSYLHCKGIVHGDVKAQNVLISNNGTPLLCDFGLSKALDKMMTSTESKGNGSTRWMAPELFENMSRSMASDVYSYGMTIAEVLSGQPPFPEIPDSVAVIFHVVFQGGRPPQIPMEGPNGQSYLRLWKAAERCWAKEVDRRPYITEVLTMLLPMGREV